MTNEQAKILLGKKYENLSDEQVKQIVVFFSNVSKYIIEDEFRTNLSLK